MTLTRRTGALSALALTLALGACSTPDDLVAPTLEPQFGTSQNDYGVDVAYASAGRVYVLSELEGYTYDQDDYTDRSLDDAILSRYDGNGNLVWSQEIDSAGCSFDDYYCDDTGLKVNTLVADARGYSYSLMTYDYVAGDCATVYDRSVHKYDASGNFIRSVYVGGGGYPFGGGTGATQSDAVDLAVDGSGNLYVVRQAAAFYDDYCEATFTNVVAKYSATGTLLWQRTSPVGTLYGVALSSSGFVYVAGSGGVAKYSNSGDLRWKVSGDTRDIAVSGTSSVYARSLTTVRKLNADGKQLWSKAQTGLSGLVIGDMTTDSSANVYITGKYSASSTNRDVFTRKLASSNGATSFSKTFGASVYDDARGIATINGSEVFITGATKGPLAPPYRGGEQDGYVRELNSSGTPVWTR